MARTTTVHLLTGDYPDRLDAARRAAEAAAKDEAPRTMLDEDPYMVLVEEYEALKAEALEAGTTVEFEAVGRKTWRELKEKHPPAHRRGRGPRGRERRPFGRRGHRWRRGRPRVRLAQLRRSSPAAPRSTSGPTCFLRVSGRPRHQGVGDRQRGAPGPKRSSALADEERRLELRVAHYWRLTPGEFRALPDDEQDEMTFYVTELCPDCGNLRSVCSDRTRRQVVPAAHRLLRDGGARSGWRDGPRQARHAGAEDDGRRTPRTAGACGRRSTTSRPTTTSRARYASSVAAAPQRARPARPGRTGPRRATRPA